MERQTQQHIRLKETLENLIARYKVALIVIGIGVVLFAIVFPILVGQANARRVEAIEAFEAIEDDYDEFTKSYAFYKEHDSIPQEEIDSLVQRYDDIIAKHPNEIAAQKSALYGAIIYTTVGDLEKAATYYENALALRSSSYLSPRILFNLASTYEELERNEDALAMFQKLYDSYPDSLLAPHALFNLARIHEEDDDTDTKQLETSLGFYNLLIENEKWSGSPWVNIAKSRLAILNKLGTEEATETAEVSNSAEVLN